MTREELNKILENHKRGSMKANLCGADLHGANLWGADLHGANLRVANLCGANLCGANLCGANLCGAKNLPFIPYACPDFGMFIGFKKSI